jgi:hypothetical protein
MQEHWIHSWGKREIEDFMDILDFKSHIKCFDDNILMDPLERRRGQAGVAICYNKNIANLVDKLPDGGNRVVAIRINTEKPIVIICVYLPTRSHKITKDDYIMVLDELAEIVTKYRNSSDILIGGDVNASIHRSKLNSRDNDFQKFLMELNLKIPTMCPVQSTFYHFNNRDESQIDYFVESVGMVEKYITFQRESLNTSSHDPIMIVINRKLCKNQNYDGKIHTHLIKWNKVDLNEYEKLVEMEMKLKLKRVEALTVSNTSWDQEG